MNEMQQEIVRLSNIWMRFVGVDHHKDRDCHWYIETRWSYGYPPKYVTQHYGYIIEKIEEEYDTYEEALQFLKETLIQEIKEYKSYHTNDEDEFGF